MLGHEKHPICVLEDINFIKALSIFDFNPLNS